MKKLKKEELCSKKIEEIMRAQIELCKKLFLSTIFLFSINCNAQKYPTHLDFSHSRADSFMVMGRQVDYGESSRTPGYLDINFKKKEMYIKYIDGKLIKEEQFPLVEVIVDPINPELIYLIYEYHSNSLFHNCFIVSDEHIVKCHKNEKKKGYTLIQYYVKAE